MIRSNLTRLRLEKAARDGRDLPIARLKRETGVSQPALDRLAQNRATRADFDTIDALCKYFNCGVGDLLEYVEDEPAPDGEEEEDE